MSHLLSCKWLADWLMNLMEKLENKGKVGKLLSYFSCATCLLIIGTGIMFMFALNYGLVETLGFFNGGARVLVIFFFANSISLFTKKQSLVLGNDVYFRSCIHYNQYLKSR